MLLNSGFQTIVDGIKKSTIENVGLFWHGVDEDTITSIRRAVSLKSKQIVMYEEDDTNNSVGNAFEKIAIDVKNQNKELKFEWHNA